MKTGDNKWKCTVNPLIWTSIFCLIHTTPLEQKRGVIRTLQHRAESIPTFPEAREQENNHIKQALNKCGYPNWPFIKTHTKQKREVKQLEQRINKFRGEKSRFMGLCAHFCLCVCVCVCVCGVVRERERDRCCTC